MATVAWHAWTAELIVASDLRLELLAVNYGHMALVFFALWLPWQPKHMEVEGGVTPNPEARGASGGRGPRRPGAHLYNYTGDEPPRRRVG